MPVPRQRSAMRPGRRLGMVGAAGAAVGLLGASGGLLGSAPALADATTPVAVVNVEAPGGAMSQQSISLEQLQQRSCATDDATSLSEYTRGGTIEAVDLPGAGNPSTGTWTLSAILGCLADPVASVSVEQLVVVGDSGPELGPGSVLSGPAGDLDPTSSDFADPAESPVISDLGSSLQYDRPWRGGGDADFGDELTQSDPIVLDVYEGPSLSVQITPSAANVPVNAPVTVSASVGGGQGQLTYDWQFPDSGVAAASTPNPTVSFPAPGSYTVELAASDAAGGAGTATTTITVTSASAAPTATSGATSRPGAGTNPSSGAPTHGPRRGHRGGGGSSGPGATGGEGASGPGATRGRGSSGGEPPARAAGSASVGPSRGATGPRRGSPTARHRPRRPAAATPSATTPGPTSPGAAAAPPRAAAKPAPSARGPSTRAPAATPTAPRSRASARATTTPPSLRPRRARTVLVRGRLIGDVTLLPANADPLDATRGGGAHPTAARRASTASPWPWIAAGLAGALLLAAGAGRELRGAGALRLRA